MGMHHLHLLLLFTPAALGLMVARCPEGWIARGETDQCYRVHSYGSDRSFDDARVYCQARGGDLAYIDSTELRDWLGQLMASSGHVGQDTYMWVGGRLVDGKWKWIEPNIPIDPLDVDWDGAGTGDCAAFTLDSKLIKHDCGEKLKFICHRDIRIPMACDLTTGWEDAGDRCYKKSRSSNSWHDSEVECGIEGGHLVTIENNSEQQLAHDLAVEERDKVWIGYTEEGHPGTFKWADGSNSSYTRWHDGQPDLSFNGYGAAVVDNDDPSGEWMVDKITNEYHYLCEKPTGSCLPGWEEFERSCYYFNTEPTDYKVWEDAKSTCDAVGAMLAVLDTELEDAFFRSHIPSSQFLIWIGLKSDPGRGSFYWEDGMSMGSKNYTHMTKDDENEALSLTDPRCVTTQEILDEDGMTKLSSWVPQECHSPYPYACEAEAGASLTLIPPDNKRYCPDGGWVRLGDHCYLFSAEEKTWTSAQKYCKNQHSTADLVSVLTWAEQDFVNTHQLAGGWMGLNKRTEGSKWMWSDGNEPTIFNWQTGEPNSVDETCGEMLFSNGRWNDAFCTELRAFSCKMPASNSPVGTITTTTAIPDSSACGYDWTENPTTGECYRIEVMDMVQRDARLHCQELYYSDGQSQPDLVSIYSQEEQTFIYNLLVSQHLSQTSAWIGMKNDYEINEWLDGTPSRYYNFEDGEPNSYYSEECIEMYTGTGRWNDAVCSLRRPFICEKKGRNYVAIQPPPPPDALCPSGWFHWNNKCYYFSDDNADWFKAEKNCIDLMGSNLASITNIDENNFIQGHLSDSLKDAWIGLRDDDNGNNWHWTDGTLFEWSHWGDGEPNNANGEEHCGQMRSYDYYYDGKWNDMKCNEKYYYVCKMDVKSCPQNWAYKDGKCYYVSDFEATRNEGELKCNEMHGKATLVNIHSEEENNYFNDLLLQSSQSCWMGLVYDGTNWTWADGTSMDYSNWNGGEPNHLDTEFCGEMIDYPNGLENGKWNNLHCGESRAFGCELYPTHAIGCEEGWEAFEDYCYWYSDTVSSTHDSARQECQSRGADLVSIHTPEENDFMYSLQGYSYSCAFIGFTDIGHHNLFTWDDGTPVVYTQISSFMSSNLFGDKLCGCINSDFYVGLWTLTDCDYTSPFLCKKPKEAIPLHPEVTGCNENDYYYETSCYNFPGASASWEDSKKDCESRGQQLVALEDRFETSYFSAIIGELGVKVWLGLSGTIAGDGSVTFSWANGNPLDYTYWDKYEPNPNYGTCVAASGERSGFWQVRKCADAFQYVCEYDRTGYTTPPPPTTRPPSDYCIYGWVHRGQSCYKVVQEAAMWGEAEEKCVMFGGHLASVKDEGEQILILALPGMDEVTNKSGSVWVGLVMNEVSGYEWTDGTAAGYLNWEAGQPNSHEGREECVSADGKTLKLSNSVCLTHFAYVCEAPTGNMMTTATPPTKPPLQQCSGDPSWYKRNAYCYKFVSSTEEMGLSWWKAHKRCRDEGGELASIITHEENYWIESMIYDKSDRVMWIGGRAKIGTGYEWLDGQPFIYDNWATGEPNKVHNQEDCISMYTNNQGYWNDQNCGSLAGRICKRREGATLPPPKTTTVPDGHCPEGWIHAGKKCVYFMNERYNFTTARQVCQKLGRKMDLASIHSAAEQAYLTAAMVTADKHMWIGMRYEEGFYWVDQSDVTYLNWGSGEPNGGSGKEECVEVSSDTGLWNDISCSDEFGAVCMMTQDPNLPDHHTPNKCPSPHSNYMAYNGACYRAINTPQKWEDAEATCAKEDAHLASIMTIPDNSFLWAAGQESGFSSYWLGLKKKLESFDWSDGWPTVYTNWGDNEPDSLHRCVYMNVSNGRWYTEGCDQSHTFICKYTNETPPTPDPPVTGYCPDQRWTDLNGGYCYLFSNETRTFDEANRVCMQEESQLVSIHSAGEMTLVTLHMHKYNEPFWIGLLESNSGERWTDGTSLNYLNWRIGEPNSHGEQCTEALAKTGDWNDVDCAVSRYYICKRRKIQEATEIPPNPPTSQKPGGGGGGGSSGISGGGIAGIVIAVLFVLCAMGFVGYSYVQKQQKQAKTQGHPFSLENASYNAGNTNRTGNTLEAVPVVNVLDGSDA